MGKEKENGKTRRKVKWVPQFSKNVIYFHMNVNKSLWDNCAFVSNCSTAIYFKRERVNSLIHGHSHTRKTLWKSCGKEDQIKHIYNQHLPVSPSPRYSLLSTPLTFSLSLAPWRPDKCAQISVMGWEFITFTLRPFMRSHPEEVCLSKRSAVQ